MNGARAKSLRRAVYGDMAYRQPRKYQEGYCRKYDEQGKMTISRTLSLPADSLRAQYQALKRRTNAPK